MLVEYRAGKMSDKDFLAARAEMKKADADFDVAFTKESERDHAGEARAKAEAAHAAELSKQGGLF